MTPFKYHVFTHGKLLFSRDDRLRLRLIDETLRQYLDWKQFTKTVLGTSRRQSP